MVVESWAELIGLFEVANGRKWASSSIKVQPGPGETQGKGIFTCSKFDAF